MAVISVKYTSIFVVAAFAAGSFFAPPEQQAIAAVIATDVQCTGCVGTADLAGNAVTSVKIKDGEVKTEDIAASAIGSARIKDNDVKAQDLAPDSVGASELQGVSKLLFHQCALTSGEQATGLPPNGGILYIDCEISGVDSDDTAIVTLIGASGCIHTSQVNMETNNVEVQLFNDCPFTAAIGLARIAVVVFDK